MRMSLLLLAGVLGLACPGGTLKAQEPDFTFLRPWFTVTRHERDTLSRRGVVVRALPAEGRQIAVIATCAIDLSPDGFIARVGSAWEIERKDSAAGRFADPPVIGDLARLSLDQSDIDRLRSCRTGDCRLNLGNHEISAVRSALTRSGGEASKDIQQTFRTLVLDRASRYWTGGLAALPEYDDRSEPVRPADIFSEMLKQSPYLESQLPTVAAYLRQFPAGNVTPSASFLQWSKVMMNGKAVVRVSHIGVFRRAPGPHLPAVVVAGKQVYASRYMNGELTLTMLFAGSDGSTNYLVHVDRSELDELGGAFSGLKRSLIEGRIKEEAIGALTALRDRLERSR